MKGMIKLNTVFVIVLLLAKGIVFAQQGAEQVQKNFNGYAANTFQEKLYAHTDKNAYTAGEILWFKVYNVDAINMRPLSISKVVYAELIDNNQNAVLQTKIAMNGGTGNGSWFIPLTVSTGNYTLRAYTSWMKNFGADYYYSKQISVINPLKSPDASVAKEAPAYDIQFFPEGGNLVAGISSTVGFKVSDQWGKGLSASGAVLDQKNDTVAKFQALKFGMGRFRLKPVGNSAYHAIINIGGKIIKKDLPSARSDGFVINLADDGSGHLSVNVNTNSAGGNVYLFAQTRNVVKEVQAAVITNNTAHFVIDKSKLGDGVSQITLFNGEKKPVCERLYFKRPAKNLTVSAQTDAQQYTSRKKVSLAINTKTPDGSAAADLSLAVYRLDSLEGYNNENIQSYFWLRSDLRGYIESPDYYFSNDVSREEAADNLMLTQGWRRFNWDDVLANKKPAFHFVPEINGPVITAKVTNKAGGEAAGDILTYLGITGKSVQLYTAISDVNGRLLFNMRNFYGPAEIVAETNTEVDTTHHIDILTPFSEQFAKLPLQPLQVTSSMENLFEDASLNMQVQNIYNGNKLAQFYKPNADSSAFYGNVYNTYMLDLYTRFTTIEEIMREYVKEVTVTHLHNQFRINVLNEKGFLHEGNPLVLVDGIPFFNMNKVFAIDPLRLRRLTDVPYGYNYGPAFADGIFSFTSYKGDFGGAETDKNAVVMDYEGLQQQRQFYSPAYDTGLQAADRMPDFRNVLYWSPSVNTGPDGKTQVSFNTSDLTGKFIGILQGITPNGAAGSQSFAFEVKSVNSAQVNK